MKKVENIFTAKQIIEILKVDDYSKKVYMPNEIFEDMIRGIEDEDGNKVIGFFNQDGERNAEFKNTGHIAYAYSYIYLAHYMYRYCKHYYTVNSESKGIDESMIRKLLQVGAKSISYNYITKKDGLLNRLGYIRKENDIPTRPILAENHKGKWELEYFVMESEYPEIYSKKGNRKINYPIKGFHRYSDSRAEMIEDGVYFDVSDTHLINIDIFIFCMSDVELGVEAFYLYCYLKYKNDKFRRGFNISIERLVKETGLGLGTIRRKLTELEKRNMIEVEHMPFCTNKEPSQITKANRYKVKPHNYFHTDSKNYNIIQKHRKLTSEQYAKEVGFVGDENYEIEDDISLDLPF